jgi:ABC-type transporter Mla maintaining outer membrane lipid asymmetry ATPase subunit MlaF
MKSEAALAVSYLARAAEREVYVGVPEGGTSRVHLPDDAAKGRFVTAVLKAKCQADEALELFGEPVTGLAAEQRLRVRRRVAALSPVVGLVSSLNVWENISLPAAYHGAPPVPAVASLAHEVLESLGVEARPFLARLPEELGPLERKTAAFVRLLVAAPALAIVDALDEGLSRAERLQAARFEGEFRARLPRATLLYVDSEEEQ